MIKNLNPGSKWLYETDPSTQKKKERRSKKTAPQLLGVQALFHHLGYESPLWMPRIKLQKQDHTLSGCVPKFRIAMPDVFP